MIHNVANTTELTAALTKAAAGDTVRLAAGNYGTYTIRDKTFATTVRIESADAQNPATFDRLTVRGSANLSFADLELGRALASGEPHFTQLHTVRDSQNITFSRVNVHGSIDNNPDNDGQGLLVVGSRDILIEQSTFAELYRGLGLDKSFNVVVRENTFRTLRSDGIVATAVEGVVIADNLFTDIRPTGSVHADAIQFWNTGQTKGSKNITIENNQILMGGHDGVDKAVQGIFISDPLEFGYDNILIRNNLLYSNDAFHGINIDGGRQVQVTDNTVLSKRTDGEDFWIRLADSIGVVLDRNIADNILMKNVTKLFSGENVNLRVTPDEASLFADLLSPSGAADLIAPGIGYSDLSEPAPAPVSDALASALVGSMNPRQGQQALRAVQIVDDLDPPAPTFSQVFADQPATVFENRAVAGFSGSLGHLGGDFSFRNAIYSDHFALA